MAAESFRKKSAILDWKNEKKYQQSVLKNATVSDARKNAARARIKEADAMIKKLTK